MLKEERLEYILGQLEKNRRATLAELSRGLRVSEDTVRRDIELLSRAGKLTKVRGGAIPHSPNTGIAAFKDRIHLSERAKEVISAKAISLLRPGHTVLLDGGTTTFTLAKLLPRDLPLTVVTNSLPVASSLIEHPLVEVVFAGGRVFKSSQVTVGAEATGLFRNLHVDLYFAGICSLHPELGITTPDMGEAEVKRAMVECAGSVAALTTLNKIGTAETYKVCGIDSVSTIITEGDREEEVLVPFEGMGIVVL